ncbi:MAG: hypothetical protein SOV49_07115 [Erysipelotrichaceae bacterium]|nr:hypothetical protein [Erysipelotrichaceae bacterium]MDY4641989.1 hypothetical protein [Erysipelotrichaceae bacterium]
MVYFSEAECGNEKLCGIELSDDFLNQVSSGRQMNAYSCRR